MIAYLCTLRIFCKNRQRWQWTALVSNGGGMITCLCQNWYKDHRVLAVLLRPPRLTTSPIHSFTNTANSIIAVPTTMRFLAVATIAAVIAVLGAASAAASPVAAPGCVGRICCSPKGDECWERP
ncbi:hypothetical protein GQ42DRAFT_172606 [Ramicandelaber brevisporus]|nr:hypothetical protein GQ42DRAFT_172606 [Ramicandelaber brevisporus]